MEKIKFTDLEGVEKEYILINSFESKASGKIYAFCITEDNDPTSLMPFELRFEGEDMNLYMIDENDIEELKEIITSLEANFDGN